MAEQEFYRVWNVIGKGRDGSPKYNGFIELAALSPKEAVKIAEKEEWKHRESPDAIIVDFEV